MLPTCADNHNVGVGISNLIIYASLIHLLLRVLTKLGVLRQMRILEWRLGVMIELIDGLAQTIVEHWLTCLSISVGQFRYLIWLRKTSSRYIFSHGMF